MTLYPHRTAPHRIHTLPSTPLPHVTVTQFQSAFHLGERARKREAMNDEAAIGEAVASLSARLDAAGLDDAQVIAHGFVTDLLRHGWRPNVRRPVEEPRTGPRATNPAEHVARLRAELRRPTAEETA